MKEKENTHQTSNQFCSSSVPIPKAVGAADLLHDKGDIRSLI